MSPQNNYLVFMAELFWWFELAPPSFVRPRLLSSPPTGQSHTHSFSSGLSWESINAKSSICSE